MRLRIERKTFRLAKPLLTSYGEVGGRDVAIVTLTDDDGLQGLGEAAPLQPYDGVSVERVLRALGRHQEAIEGAEHDLSSPQAAIRLLEACRAADPLPQALAAIDLALWDRAGRRAGKPVAELLTDAPASAVQVNAAVSATDRASAAAEAGKAAAAGFRCVKVKVGVGDDAGRVAAVRASVGPRVALRLDANGAWGVQEAIRTIDALSPAGLELVEEPTHGIEAMRAVRERVSVRVSIDETAAEEGALAAGVSDAVCLKISRCGGISALLAAATLVRATGAEVYLASTLDGPLGIAASIQAAAALASRGQVAPCGLATLSMFEGIDDPLPVVEGTIALPSAPGLGVDPGQ